MSKLPRRGRPPRVREQEDGTLAVTVKGTEYTFRRDQSGGVRPKNTVAGDAEERNYAKSLIQRQLED